MFPQHSPERLTAGHFLTTRSIDLTVNPRSDGWLWADTSHLSTVSNDSRTLLKVAAVLIKHRGLRLEIVDVLSWVNN